MQMTGLQNYLHHLCLENLFFNFCNFVNFEILYNETIYFEKIIFSIEK